MAVSVYAKLPAVALFLHIGHQLVVYCGKGEASVAGGGVFQAFYGNVQGEGYFFRFSVLLNGCFFSISAVGKVAFVYISVISVGGEHFVIAARFGENLHI